MTTALNASPKKSMIPRVTFNNNDMNYKDRASNLFEKLNSFKTQLENQKYSKHADLISELQHLQRLIQKTSAQKQSSYSNITLLLSKIQSEIKGQNNQYERYKKLMDNTVQNCNRQCQQILDKMTKDRLAGQNSIQKYIDFKIESFMLKNKGVWTQQDLCNFQPYRDELSHLKKEIEQFYKIQEKEQLKISKQVVQNLQRQKQSLLAQTRRTDTQDLMNAVESIYMQVTGKVKKMSEKRQTMEHNIFCMIENVINCYIKDMNKCK